MLLHGPLELFETCAHRGEPGGPAALRTTDHEEVRVFASVQVFRQENLNLPDWPHGTGLLSVSSSQGDQGALEPCGRHRFHIYTYS